MKSIPTSQTVIASIRGGHVTKSRKSSNLGNRKSRDTRAKSRGSRNSSSRRSSRSRKRKNDNKDMSPQTSTELLRQRYLKRFDPQLLKRNEVNCCTVIRDFFGHSDAMAARYPAPKHTLCLSLTHIMMPLVLGVIVWDMLSVEKFEIPQLSSLQQPGVMLTSQFACVLMSMYGYVMRLLLGKADRGYCDHALISFLLHLIFLLFRSWMEFYYEGFRDQTLNRFESFELHTQFVPFPVDD